MAEKTVRKVCIINCFDTYEHRVDLISEYFTKRGAEVSVCTSDFRHIDKCRRNDCKAGFRYFHALPYARNMSVTRLKSHIILARDIFAEIEKREFDLLWVLLPPNSFAKEAAKYKSRHKDVTLVFDLIDLWPESMPVSKLKASLPFAYWRGLRDRNLSAADGIVTECRLYHQKLPQDVQSKLHTVYLAGEVKEFRPCPELPGDRIALCYLGSINNIIDIPAVSGLIRGIKEHKNVTLHIIGDGEKRNEFLSACREAGAEVFYHGKIYDRKEKQKILDVCHYGLNLMKSSVFVGLTMKSIDYFEAGLPVLNNIHGDTWDFVEDNKLGYNISTAADYAKITDYSLISRKQVRSFFEKMLGADVFCWRMDELMKNLYDSEKG